MNTMSAFVVRCREALAEYSRLKAQGYSHEDAHRLSGLVEAVTGKQTPARDVKVAQVGRDE